MDDALSRAEPLSVESAREPVCLVSSQDARDELLSVEGPDDEAGESDSEAAKMFALSLIYPGSGQFVRGEKRGFLYLLAEVAFLTGFYVLDKKGLDDEEAFEDYADANWAYDEYMEWYEEYCLCEGCNDDDYACRPLAEYGTQEYYEDIGKYDTYWRWWHYDGDEDGYDWENTSADDLAMRDTYWGMRGDSNRHLRQARYLLTAAFLNHIVSGVDAFLSANRGEDESDRSWDNVGLEFDVPDSGEGLSCAMIIRY